jgi:hypothetical protein
MMVPGDRDLRKLTGQSFGGSVDAPVDLVADAGSCFF